MYESHKKLAEQFERFKEESKKNFPFTDFDQKVPTKDVVVLPTLHVKENGITKSFELIIGPNGELKITPIISPQE